MEEGKDTPNYLDCTRIQVNPPAGTSNEFYCSIYKIKVMASYSLVIVNYSMTFNTVVIGNEEELFYIPRNKEKIYMNRQLGTYIDGETSTQLLVKMKNTGNVTYVADNSNRTIKQGGTFYINTVYMED